MPIGRTTRRIIAAAAVLLAVAGVGLATGTLPGVPDSKGVIHGCYRQTARAADSGRLRLVPAGRRCRRGEAAIAFNQRGPKGPQGAAGPPGTRGPQGDAGRPGSDAQLAGAAAGGDLRGTYPDPSLADGAVTPAKLAAAPAASVGVGLCGTPDTPACQAIADGGGGDVVAFRVESFDTAGLADLAAAPDGLVAPAAGIYSVDAFAMFSPNGAGVRQVSLETSGGCCPATATTPPVSTGITAVAVSGLVRLDAGDKVSVRAIQAGSGATLTVRDGRLSMAYVGRA